MRTLVLAVALVGQLVSTQASAAPAVRATARAAGAAGALTPQQIKSIRALIQAKLDKYKAPGASFAIGRNDRIVWTEGFGLADVENHVRATPQTAYRSASIGKAMTATAAMKLIEHKQLDPDALVHKYCFSFLKRQWPITVMQLITHTSGIRHYEGPNVDAEAFNLRHFAHVSDALEMIRRDSLKIQPGSDMLYSTWGYVVLGCVIENASHEEFRAHMRSAIFEPSGMKDTRDDDPRAVVPNRASGYVWEGDTLKNSRWSDMSSKMAAGGFLTTAPDLVRFMNAWMGGRLLSRASMDLMLQNTKLNDGGTVDNFGHGWFIDDYHGMKAGLYGGGTPQVSGVVFFVPEKQLAISGLFNLEGIPGPERIVLAEAIADVVLGHKTPNPDHFTPPH